MFKSQESKILTNQTQFNINKTEQKEFLCSYTQVAKINKNHYDCDSQFFCRIFIVVESDVVATAKVSY